MYHISVSQYPNREVRLTLVKERSRPASSPKGGVGRVDSAPPSTQSPPTLDISSELETPPKTPLRKASQFGLNAKRTLLRIGGALAAYDPNPNHSVFLTGTLPGSTPEAMKAISVHSSWLIHRVKAWVAKRVTGKFDFYVWELQKRGALHLHYCVYCPDPEKRADIISGWHDEWCRLLLAVGEDSGCNMWQKGFGDRRITRQEKTQAFAQEVYKGVGSYLAKYCSKSESKANPKHEKYYPKRWWGCSRPLLHLMEDMSREATVSFGRLSEAYRWFEGAVDDLFPLSTMAYTYPHKVGVGATNVSYFSQEMWKWVEKTMDRLVNFGQSKPDLDYSFRRRVSVELKELMQRFSTLAPLISQSGVSWSSRFITETVNLVNQKDVFTSQELRRIHSAAIYLSSRLTCMKMFRFLLEKDKLVHANQVQFIWLIQDSGFNLCRLSGSDCKFLLRFLDSKSAGGHVSTNPVPTRTDPPTETEPEPSSLPSQLTLFD